MKNIDRFITEARQEPETELYFETPSAALLYALEIEGQISDGYWENSRPMSHWKWVTNTKVIVDKNHEPGYSGPRHRINYSCKWLITYLKKCLAEEDQYLWCQRFLNYVKFGKLINESDVEKCIETYAYRAILGDLPAETVTAEEFENGNYMSDYHKNTYWPKLRSELDDKFFKKFYKIKYSVQDFKADVSDLEDTINTFIA